MTDILTPEKAAAELGSILRRSRKPAERIKAAQALGGYSAGGDDNPCKIVLQEALKTEKNAKVRAAIEQALANIRRSPAEAGQIDS